MPNLVPSFSIPKPLVVLRDASGALREACCAKLTLAPDLLNVTTEVLDDLLVKLTSLKLGHMFGVLDWVDALSVGRSEDDIQLFKRTTLWFGEEEVNRRNDAGTEDSEHGVCVVAQVGESRWRDHDDQEVRKPVRAGTERVGLDTNTQVGNPGRVQPSHSKPANGEHSVESE